MDKEQVVDIPGTITKIRQKRMKMVQNYVSPEQSHSLAEKYRKTYAQNPTIEVCMTVVCMAYIETGDTKEVLTYLK